MAIKNELGLIEVTRRQGCEKFYNKGKDYRLTQSSSGSGPVPTL